MNAPKSRTIARIASTLAVATLSLAGAACSSATVEPARAPAAPTGAAACHPTDQAKVLARKVFVPAGVEASVQGGGGFSVHYATAASHCVAVDWDSSSDRPRPSSCPTPGARSAARENADDETMLAWESHDEPEPRITLGVVTYDAPHSFFGVGVAAKTAIVKRTFSAPVAGRDEGQMAPALASIGHDRFLLAWVDGNVEHRELRAQSVVGWGDPLGAPMVLSPEGASVSGHPSVVVAPTGHGLATYVASIDGEFDVLATPIACEMN